MGKAKPPPRAADNEAKAVARMLRVSPQKLNLVAQLIRGKKVGDGARRPRVLAQARIAQDVKKCLRAPSPTPRTTTTSTSTSWSSPRPWSARRW